MSAILLILAKSKAFYIPNTFRKGKKMAALEFLKNRIVILMQERDKAINRADELQDTVQNAKDQVTKVKVSTYAISDN